MNGVLGAEGDELPDDIPETFTTELGYYSGLQPQYHNKETDVLRTSLTKPALLAATSGGDQPDRLRGDAERHRRHQIGIHRRLYKKIKILHLDFTAREALNTDARENNSLSESVVVRFTS
jgi:hypothetical protein